MITVKKVRDGVDYEQIYIGKYFSQSTLGNDCLTPFRWSMHGCSEQTITWRNPDINKYPVLESYIRLRFKHCIWVSMEFFSKKY